MHAPYDKRQSSHRTEAKSKVGFFILPAIVAIALTALTSLQPKATFWISQAVQAEFAGATAVELPVETAEPGMMARTGDAD